jgi:hypothetical protein
MFEKIVYETSQLNEKEQLDLLRALIEGDLSYEIALTLAATGNLKNFRKESLVSSELKNLRAIFSFERPSPEANAIVEQYRCLPIQKRLNNKNEYNNKLSSYKKQSNNESIMTAFENIQTMDETFILAINLLTTLLAKMIYDTPHIKTTLMLKVFGDLKQNPSKEYNTDFALMPAIERFQLFYNILTHSYISQDKRDFIKATIGIFLEREMLYRTPIIKKIIFLTKLKAELKTTDLSLPQIPFFSKGKQLPDGFEDLQSCLQQLPRQLDVNNESVDVDIRNISRCFNEVDETVKTQKPKTLFRAKEIDDFWNNLSIDLQEIKAEDDIEKQVESPKVKK